MFRPDRPHDNLDKKIYRFALFGMSGSGKTCLLTAMGMVCRPTTDGSCCSPLPAHRLASPEVQEGWATLQENARNFSNVGELPKPNEVKLGNFPRYRYVYTDPKIGTAYFEIIDYTGGLTHHSHFRHEDSTELLKHLTEHDIDAIIVLVSAPKEGQEQSDIPDEIATISKAFNFMQSQRATEHHYPIALALTKWDRRWERNETIPPNDADAEAGRLAQFMAQCTAYQTVRNILKEFAGNEECFKMFPVSALGRCSDGRSPDIVPLEAYGLPFVFGWLIQAVNDSDFHRFEMMQSKLSWWQVLPLVPRVLAKYTPAWAISVWEQWTLPVQKTWSLGKSLLNRLPETKEGEKKRTAVKTATKQLTSILWTQILITAFVFAVLPSIGVMVSNTRMLANVEKYEANALTSFNLLVAGRDNEQIQKEGRRFLDDYPNSSAGQEVVAKMVQSQKVTDEAEATNLWTQINNLLIEDNGEVQILGRQYLDKFLTGKHREEVIAKMTEAQRLHNEKIAQKKWEEFEREVREAFKEGNVPSALETLAEREQKNYEWMALCSEMLSKTTETVKRKIDTLGIQYDRRKEEVRRSQDAVHNLLSKRRIPQADAVERELNALFVAIEEQEDKYLYSQVVNRRTKEACEAYLKKSPKQTMLKSVDNYRQYISKLNGEIDIRITATLNVGNKVYAGNSPTSFILLVDNVQKINIANLNPLGFKKNARLELTNNQFRIRKKLTDSINIRVEMMYHPSIKYGTIFRVGEKDQGRGGKRLSVRDFLGGRSYNITLTSNDDPNVKHTLTLKATGFPQEPPLPNWRP